VVEFVINVVGEVLVDNEVAEVLITEVVLSVSMVVNPLASEVVSSMIVETGVVTVSAVIEILIDWLVFEVVKVVFSSVGFNDCVDVGSTLEVDMFVLKSEVAVIIVSVAVVGFIVGADGSIVVDVDS